MVNSSWDRGALACVPSNVTSEGRAFPFGASNHRALSSAPSQSMLRKRMLLRNQGE